MYTNVYVYKPPRLFMAGKLYWRIKKDGKWTWKPAQVCDEYGIDQPDLVVVWKEEEQ